MKYLVTGQEMKEYDNHTINHLGIPGLMLMENAATKVFEHMMELPGDKRVLVVCGIGNNGGDGLALARMLIRNKCEVSVCIIGNRNKATESFLYQLKTLEELGFHELSMEQLMTINENTYTHIVDAVFGVGLSREVTGDYALAINKMNDLNGYKLAVDIPSGICADTGKILGCAFKADTTITFAFEKVGLVLYPGANYAGRVLVEDIGITDKAFGNCPPSFYTYCENPMNYMPQRLPQGNKGTFGKVLVIAGFETMIGAAILCARAALEMGAGMVKVICEPNNRSILQVSLPEILYSTSANLLEDLAWADVVVVGPGFGKGEEVKKIFKNVLCYCKLPVIVDADALNLISESDELADCVKQYKHTVVLTPHVGELSRLAHQNIKDVKDNLLNVAKMVAKEYHSIVVSKDARTFVVLTKGMIYLNTSGNNGMATAGSGDVLAGIIGALTGQGLTPGKAACLGVYLHGLAGDKARDLYTEYGVTASRLIENIRKFKDMEL